MVFLGLTVFELALFWRSVNIVNMMNEEIASNAVFAPDVQTETMCNQAQSALSALQSRDIVFARRHLNYTDTVIAGMEPYAQYRFTSNEQINGKPVAILDVDCQNPEIAGITTQLRYRYHLTLISAKIPTFGGEEPIEIFPASVEIVSAKKKIKAGY